MPLTCPACNKANQSDATCPRCGCDLSRLHQLAAASTARLADALTALEEFDWPEALNHASSSWRLRHSAASARLAFLAATAAGQTQAALRWHRRATDLET